MSRQYRRAGWLFEKYEQLLPGNTDTIFFKALMYEGINDRQSAANEYVRYLNSVQQGYQANHARARLGNWGYTSPHFSPRGRDDRAAIWIHKGFCEEVEATQNNIAVDLHQEYPTGILQLDSLIDLHSLYMPVRH
jgi:hypothetical protein